MSKITSKNLQYDNALPPFLARLQANSNTSRDGRHEFNVARPKKPRDLEQEAEDEPVYFVEQTGESLTKSEWEERETEQGAAVDPAMKGGGSEGSSSEAVRKPRNAAKKTQEKIAAIGNIKKRKLGKTIGTDEGEAEKNERRDVEKNQLKTQEMDVNKGKAAKKLKKIKLSFGDDE